MLSVMSAMVVVRRSPPAHACQTPDASLAADRYFVSLTRPDVGFNVIYPRASLPTFKPRDRAARTADGILIVLVVDAIDAEYERLTAAGTAILTTIETEEWGERYFQVEDPNGVIVQLVQWIAAPPRHRPTEMCARW